MPESGKLQRTRPKCRFGYGELYAQRFLSAGCRPGALLQQLCSLCVIVEYAMAFPLCAVYGTNNVIHSGGAKS